MHYEDHAPPAALRTVVDRLWILETSADDTTLDPILPDGHPEVIVHLGTPFGQADARGRVRAQAPVLFAGQLTRAVRIAPRGPARVVGARLHPHAGVAIVRAPQHTLADRVVDLATLNPGLARALTSQEPGRTRDADLEAFARLLDQAADRAALDSAVTRAVSLGTRLRGLVPVERLAVAAAVSPRQLERVFRRDVGLSPKIWLRTIRFQEVLRTIRDGGSRRWVNVALAHGFYDQSHFVRDFKAFTGQPPSAWNVSTESLTAIFSAVRRRTAQPLT